MRRSIYLFFIFILLFLTYIPKLVSAGDHVFSISGHSTPDANRDEHKRLADEFVSSLNERPGDLEIHPTMDPEKDPPETSKELIENGIKRLKGKLKCGDNITIFYSGAGVLHSGVKYLQINATQRISIREMKSWLNEALKDAPCCCKIHLIINARYGGNFCSEIFSSNKHVVTAVSSSEGSHSPHMDETENIDEKKDWSNNFLRKFKEQQEEPGVQDAIIEGQEHAIEEGEKEGSIYGEDKPQTYLRLKGHVDKIEQERRGAPKKITLKNEFGHEHIVILTRNERLKLINENIIPGERDYCYLDECFYINVTLKRQDDGDYEHIKKPEVLLDMKGAWGHIDEVDRENETIKVHFLEPWYLKCKTKIIKMVGGNPIPAWVEVCKYLIIEKGHRIIKKEGDIHDIEATDIEEIEKPVIELKGHVRGVNKDENEVTVHIMEPEWERCQEKKVIFKDEIPDWVQYCKWIKFTGMLVNGIIEATDIEEIEPISMSFKGHVRGRDGNEVTVHIMEPEWERCQEKQVIFKDDIPDWVGYCKWIEFTGKLVDGIIEATDIKEIEPISMSFKGHVRGRDGNEVTVHIMEPEWERCQEKQVIFKDDIPDWVGYCKWIEFTGKLVDGIIEATDIKEIEPISMSFKGHVNSEVKTEYFTGDRYVEVYIMEPDNLKYKIIRVYCKDGFPDWVEFCKWIKFTGILYENEIYGTTDIEEIEPISMPLKGHVFKVDKTGIWVLIVEPLELIWWDDIFYCKEGIPDWIGYCKWIEFTGKLVDDIFEATDIKEIEPVITPFKGHVREVFPEDNSFEFHISSPKLLWCESAYVWDVPDEWIRKLKYCDWVQLNGIIDLEGIKLDKNKIDYTDPVITTMEGHVDDELPNDNKRIIVDIYKPHRVGKCTVEYKGTGSLNQNIKECEDIKIKGYMIKDDYIITEEEPIILASNYNDAGCYRCVLPKSHELPFTTISPTVCVKNYGDSSISNFQVSCRVDSAGSEIYRDSKLVSTLIPGDTTNVIFNEWSTGPEGSKYTVYFKTRLPGDENLANDKISQNVIIEEVVLPDTIPPEVEIITPTNGDTVSGYVPITAQVVDNRDPYPLVEFLINDSLVGQTNTMPYQYLWNASSLIPGNMHNIKVRATDSSYNTGEDIITVIIADTGVTNQPPVLSGGDVFPDSGSYISHTPFTYTVHYFDPDGDTATICKVIIIDGNDSTHYTMTLVSGTPSNGTYREERPYLYPPQSPPYRFIFIATDEHGYTVISQEYFGPTVTTY